MILLKCYSLHFHFFPAYVFFVGVMDDDDAFILSQGQVHRHLRTVQMAEELCKIVRVWHNVLQLN